MSKNIVYEGWLTKSPPTKRIWRTKWRRRWFALRQSGELPGQYFLDYYADRNCRRLKGSINLDLCEQVDAGLHMERTSSGALDPKLRGSVFTIQTQQRTYHLEADCEADMEKWVDAICRVCGLRATDETPDAICNYQNNMTANEQYGDSTGPYIPISECITGVRAQGNQAFTFDRKKIVMTVRTPLERVSDNRNHQMYTSQPHIRLNNTDLSENESNLSDEECMSLTASQSNIRDWSVAKTFTKLSISPRRNGMSGPPEPPPRPPKTLQRDTFYGPRIVEPVEVQIHESITSQPRLKRSPLPSSPRAFITPPRHDDEEINHQSLQYCNLLPMPACNLSPPQLPPAVDRALKPRHSSIGHINHLLGQTGLQLSPREDIKNDALQYLDLDLHSSEPAPPKPQQQLANENEIVQVHGKSPAVEPDSDYKTVDFLKTEAFNITRQDAEASRSNQH